MHPTTVRRMALSAVLSLLFTTLGGWLVAAPASADHGRCGFHSEADYLASSNEICRGTDIVAPPTGTLLDRAALLRAEGLYRRLGFDKSFLWFAPRTTVNTAGLTWSYCDDRDASVSRDNNGADDICDDAGEHVAYEAASNAFGGDVPVTVLGDRSTFIALVCGNSSPVPDGQIRTLHPHLSGGKFHDRDADGAQQAGEESLSGWQFRVTLVDGFLPHQPEGASTTVTTGSDGRWSLDLAAWGPGRYMVEELPRDGWRVTNGPVVREVVVNEGIGQATVDAGTFGNVYEADAAKTEFTLVDPPTRIDADTPTTLTVRAVLVNNGPAPVIDVTDAITVTGPSDCTITPATQTVTRRLAEGQHETVDVTVDVLCTEPSHHEFTFADTLTVTGDVRETDPSNNTVTFTHVIEVFDDSDLAVSDTALSCPANTTVGASFTCSGSTTVTNTGPYGPTRSDIDLSLTGPEDCSIAADSPTSLDRAALAVGESTTLTTSWTVICGQRSFHPFALAAAAAVEHLHVEDHDPADNTGADTGTVEVFEPVDLETTVTDLRCSEREINRLSSSCTATVAITNNGPATAVQTLTVIGLTPGTSCTAAPAAPVTFARTLNAGQTEVLTQQFDLACSTDVRHEARATATLGNAPSDPHAVDADSDTLVWLPSDAKPTSLPSSVNLGKEGVLPFAVLSTADTDATTEVIRDSIRYGVTGSEPSVLGCKTEGEDVDGDGAPDLICHADTAATGTTCSTTVLVATGRLTDGTRFTAQDDVHVLGCKRT